MAVKADITIDIDKQVGNLQNLTNIYNARVGDNNTPLTVLWQKNGMPLNLTGLHAFIAGKVGDGSYNSETDKVDFPVGTPVVKYEDDGSGTLDNGQSGLTTLLIPKQMWAKTGLFAGYIGLKDENGSVFTSRDIFFKVLGNVLDAGVAINYFIGDFDKALAEAEKKLEDKSANFDQITSKALQDLHDKYLQKVQQAEDTFDDTQASIDANIASLKRIATTCASIQAEIEANDVVKLIDYNQDKLNINNKIDSKLSKISANPLSFKDLNAVAEAYPNGTTSLIVTDDGHRAVYRNGEWKDGGIYNSAGVADNSIDVSKLADQSIDSTSPNLYSELSPNLKKGGFHHNDGKFEANDTWGEFSIGVIPGEKIAWNQHTYFYTFWNDDKFVSGGTTSTAYTEITVPKNCTILKIPVALQNLDDFKKDQFCIVKGGKNIMWDFPQNNVLDKFTVPLKNASMQLGYGSIISRDGEINIYQNAENWYMDLPDNAQVIYGSKNLTISNTKKILLKGKGNGKGAWLYFNPISFEIEPYDYAVDSNSLIYLGIMYDSLNPAGIQLHTNLLININGIPASTIKVLDKNILPEAKTANVVGWGNIEIDVEKSTMQFNNMYAQYNQNQLSIDSDPVDISQIKTGTWLYLDTNTAKIVCDKDQSFNKLKPNLISIGSFLAPMNPKINGSPIVYIDGVRYNYDMPLRGHKINVLGDSITYGINTARPYVSDLSTVTGADQCRNYGVPSSTIAKRPNDDISWDTAVPFIERYDQMDQDADVILIFGGVNDWVTGRKLGTKDSSDITTFYGSLNKMLDGLRKKYVGATIVLATPLKTDFTKRVANLGKEDGTNSIGLLLDNYVAVEKEIAQKYAIPVLDLFNQMFYPFDSAFEERYMTDSLHPTREGHIMLANRIGKFLNDLI